MRQLTTSEAIREALIEEMERDSRVILLGEDIGVYGGAFGVTQGLLKRFGPNRVMDTPISELSLAAMAAGAATTGLRPVLEIMFMDFILLAMDPLVNWATKLRYVFGPHASCPLVIRTPAGGGRGYGPTHSQSFEALFLHIPGLRIAVPSVPADAKGLLQTAIRDDNPVLFVEHKLLYRLRGPVPRGLGSGTPFGRARIVLPGRDLTVLAWSWMTHEAERAARNLSREGISAEVIDLRTLCPLDMETLAASVRKTGRVVIAEEGCRTGGAAAEIATCVFESCHEYLDAPIIRIAAADTPVPASPTLERAMIPDHHRIAEAARNLMRAPSDTLPRGRLTEPMEKRQAVR